MHNAWCIYLHFGSLGGFHASKLYHTIPCMIYLLLHFWLFLVVKYGKCNQDASIDIIYIECLGWFFITMTNYAKPPFCFFFGVFRCFLLNVGIYHIYHGVIIPPFGVISPCWTAPPWSSKSSGPRLAGIGVPIVAPWAMRVTLLIATRSFVNSLTWYLGWSGGLDRKGRCCERPGFATWVFLGIL